MTAETKAEQVARELPKASALAAEVKSIFGDGCKTIRMEEDGKVIETKAWKADGDYLACLDGEQFARLVALEKLHDLNMQAIEKSRERK